jgi:hypothetical protein
VSALFLWLKRITGLGAGVMLGAPAEMGRNPRARSKRETGSAERMGSAPRIGSGDERAAAPGAKAPVREHSNFKFGKLSQVSRASGTEWQRFECSSRFEF